MNEMDKLRNFTKYGSLDSLQSAIQNKNEAIHTKNGLNSSLLHIAMYYGQPDIAKELVKAGLSLTDLNKHRWSPLHYGERFHQPLNKKLGLTLRMNPPRKSGVNAFRNFQRT